MATADQGGGGRLYADGDPAYLRVTVCHEGSRGQDCNAGDWVRVRVGSERRGASYLWVPADLLISDLPPVGDQVLSLVIADGLLRLHIRRRDLDGVWRSAWIPLGALGTAERIDPMLLREGTEE